MKNYLLFLVVIWGMFSFGCAGMKVINPNDQNQEAGTKMVDFSGGSFKIVETYSCKIESMGHKVTAIGKTEKEARVEVLAKCKDRTVISFCKEDQISCVKN